MTMITMMEGLIRSSCCFVNNHIVTIYALLILMALVSPMIPIIKEMVLHGKTRQIRIRKQQQQHKGQNTKSPSSSLYFLQSDHQCNNNATSARTAAVFLEWVVNGKFWMVQKQRFLDFYLVGAIALVVTMRYSWATTTTTTTTATTSTGVQDEDEIIHTEMLWRSSTATLVAQALLLLHILRRLYECLYVHEWRSNSYMHLSVYILGIVYYAILPFIVCRMAQCEGEPAPLVLFWTDGRPIVILVPVQVLSFFLCLYGQYQQGRHHLILANLRRSSSDNEDKKYTKMTSATYSLPQGGWFKYVACPHYLAEILFYIGLAGLLQDTARGGIIVAWVVVCLTRSALETQQWYQSNIPDYAKLQRKAIIPFWL